MYEDVLFDSVLNSMFFKFGACPLHVSSIFTLTRYRSSQLILVSETHFPGIIS